MFRRQWHFAFMWPEAAASNEASWAASDEWVQRRDLPVSQRDYHSLHWLLYIYLQQGRSGDAEELLELMDQSLAQFPEDDARNLLYGTYTRANMAAAFIVETTRWGSAKRLLSTAAKKEAASPAGAGAYQGFASVARAPAVFARGLAAANEGSSDAAAASIAELRTIREQLAGQEIPFVSDMKPALEIQELEIGAVLDAARGDVDQAIATLQEATTLEEAMPPPSGPPLVVKPSHELLGELLLRAQRAAEAREQFARSLFRHPGRSRSILGAARAAAAQGDREAAQEHYGRFRRQWRQADEQSPELREAEAYVE